MLVDELTQGAAPQLVRADGLSDLVQDGVDGVGVEEGDEIKPGTPRAGIDKLMVAFREMIGEDSPNENIIYAKSCISN